MRCEMQALSSLVSCSSDCGPPPLEKNTGALMETAFFMAVARTSLMSPWLSFCRLVACAHNVGVYHKGVGPVQTLPIRRLA